MKRQIIAALMTGWMIPFFVSCVSVREIKPGVLTRNSMKSTKILALTKTSGESIVFARSSRGRVVDDCVQGEGAVESILEKTEMEKSRVKTIAYDLVDSKTTVMTQDDQAIPVSKAVVKPELIEMWIRKEVGSRQFRSLKIAVSEIEVATVRRFDVMKSLGLIAIPAIIFAVIRARFNFNLDAGMNEVGRAMLRYFYNPWIPRR